MSRWIHSICEDCYEEQEPGRKPVRVREPEEETCCFCGKPTTDGIFYRFDPSKLKCEHDDE
jgi:hypothetical protein